MRLSIGATLGALILLALVRAPSHAKVEDEKETAEKKKFFIEKVRPILFDTCIKCHGPEKSENGLRVDSRQALIDGGEAGEAVVPEKPEASLLVKALKYEEQDLQMPPDRKLEAKEIEAIEKWIKDGAVWAELEKKSVRH